MAFFQMSTDLSKIIVGRSYLYETNVYLNSKTDSYQDFLNRQVSSVPINFFRFASVVSCINLFT